MIKNCIEKLFNTKVLDTFVLKKAIAFFNKTLELTIMCLDLMTLPATSRVQGG